MRRLYTSLQSKRLQTLYSKGPHRLLWGGSWAARGKIALSGIPNSLNHCFFLLFFYFFKRFIALRCTNVYMNFVKTVPDNSLHESSDLI